VLRRAALTGAVVVSLGLGALLSACGDDGSDGSSSPPVELSAAGERGLTVAKEQGCIACHTADGGKSTGPSWEGLAGSEVTLDDGTTVIADDAYLTEAILQSRGQVVEGYANVMPVYDGEISDAELADLLAYLHDLSPGSTAETTTETTTTGG
jgi:cytochrome c oxidase subunit 2